MSYLETVQDNGTNISYTLGRDAESLGEGATAKVWRGKANPNQPDVAVKVAVTGSNEVQLAQFWDELEVMKDLSRALAEIPGAKKNIPQANRAIGSPNDKAKIIVMELIPADWQLNRQKAWPMADIIQSALQYAQVLVSLHKIERATYGDRKATDLRWDSENKRLVILDWNRAGKLPDHNDHNKEVRQSRILQDLRGFGELWIEQVLKRRPDASHPVPSVDDTNEEAWHSLPRKLRLILKKAFETRTVWGYYDAKALLTDLTWLDTWHAKNVTEIVSEAQRLLGEVEKKTDSGEQIEAAETILNLIDLARLNGLTQNTPDVEKLETWAKPLLGKVQKQTQETIKTAKNYFQLRTYSDAITAIETGISIVSKHPVALWRLYRWQIPANIYIKCLDDKLDLDPIKRLTLCVESLEQANADSVSAGQRLNVAHNNLTAVQNILSEYLNNSAKVDVSKQLKTLEYEISLRRQLLDIAQLPADHARKVQLKADFDDFRALNLSYAGNMRQAMPELDEALVQFEAQAKPARLDKAAIDTFKEKIAGLCASLSEDIRKESHESLIKAARDAYFSIPKAARDEPLQMQWRFVSWVESLEDGAEDGIDLEIAWLKGLRLPDKLDDDSKKCIASVHEKQKAKFLADIKACLERPVIWPHELDRIYKKATVLREISEMLVSESDFDEITQRQDSLKSLSESVFAAASGWFSRSTSSLGLIPINHATQFDSNLLTTLEGYFKAAIEAKVELIDNVEYKEVKLTGQMVLVQMYYDVLASLLAKLPEKDKIERLKAANEIALKIVEAHQQKVSEIVEFSKNVTTANEVLSTLNGEKFNSLPDQAKAANKAIAAVCVAAGLGAVRALDLTNANEYLAQAKAILSDQTQNDNPLWRNLADSITWLENITTASGGQFANLQNWRAALIEGDKAKAETQYSLVKNTDPKISANWVIDELEAEHNVLCGEAQKQPALVGQSKKLKEICDDLRTAVNGKSPQAWVELHKKWDAERQNANAEVQALYWTAYEWANQLEAVKQASLNSVEDNLRNARPLSQERSIDILNYCHNNLSILTDICKQLSAIPFCCIYKQWHDHLIEMEKLLVDKLPASNPLQVKQVNKFKLSSENLKQNGKYKAQRGESQFQLSPTL